MSKSKVYRLRHAYIELELDFHFLYEVLQALEIIELIFPLPAGKVMQVLSRVGG